MYDEKDLASLDDYVRLSDFADIGIGIAASKSIDEAMQEVMAKIGNILVPVSWSLLLRDRETEEVYFKLVEGENAVKLKDMRMPSSRGLIEEILKSGEAAVIGDASQDPRVPSSYSKILGFEAETILAAPVMVNGEVIAILQVVNRSSKQPFAETELNILSTIAEFAAINLEKIYYLSALKDMAHIDPLTGLYNRRSFENQFLKEVERCKRYGHALALMMIDVDGLKEINDREGQAKGDEVLKDLARIIRENTRKIDLSGRYGGEEFTVLLPHTKKHEAEVVRQRILKDIQADNERGKEVPFSVTIGLYAEGPEGVNELIQKAREDLDNRKEAKKTDPQPESEQ